MIRNIFRLKFNRTDFTKWPPVQALIFSFACLLMGFQPQSAYAQFFTGPIGRAQGGAGIAALSSAESTFYNPAHLPHIQNYLIGLYSDQNFQNYTGSDSDFAAIAVDNNPEAIMPGSLSYVQKRLDYTSTKGTGRDVQFSLGQFVLPNLSVGGSVRYYEERIDNTNDQNLWNASLGVLWTPMPMLGVGFVANNILENHTALLRPELGLGAYYSYEEIVRLRFDLMYPEKYNNDRKGIFKAGVEFPFPNGFFLRAGVKNDDVAKLNYYTAGLGWSGPKLGIDYAYQRNTQNADNGHSFDLRLYF